MVELVNPEVVEQSGEQRIVEGCLSVPGVYGYVTRPTWPRSARRTATATGSSARARASLPSASAMRPSIWTDICSPKGGGVCGHRGAAARRRGRGRAGMRLVYGHAGFRRAEPAALLDAGHEVCAVYTQPDKPQGRRQVLTAPPVKAGARARYSGLPARDAEKRGRAGTAARARAGGGHRGGVRQAAAAGSAGHPAARVHQHYTARCCRAGAVRRLSSGRSSRATKRPV